MAIYKLNAPVAAPNAFIQQKYLATSIMLSASKSDSAANAKPGITIATMDISL
jgi:hypothetical protein